MIFPVKKIFMGDVQLPSLISGGYSISRRFLNISPLNSTCSFLSHPFGIHLTSVDRGEKGDEARGRRKR
jgi:hypothetical protein